MIVEVTKKVINIVIDKTPVVVTRDHSGLTLDDGTNPHGTTKTDVGLSNVPNLDTTTAVNDSHTHSNKSILDNITESFTTALKSAYDTASNWITTNGSNVLNHIGLTSGNPHSVTKSDVGLGSVDNTSDLLKPISTATQSALDTTNNNVTQNATDIAGKLDDVTAGTNIAIDKTNPNNPVISSTASGGKFVDGTDPLDAVYTGGDVGIGTTSPDSKLGVVAPAGKTFFGMYRDDVSVNDGFFRITNYTGLPSVMAPIFWSRTNSRGFPGASFISDVISDTGNMPIMRFQSRAQNNTVNNRPLFSWENFLSAKMTMLANGNLGIGTTTPAAKLDVNGDILAESMAAESCVLRKTETKNQDNILKVLSTQDSSVVDITWRGRALFGADNTTVLMGVYRGVPAIGAHKWTSANAEIGAAWEDLFISPDGSMKTYIGASNFNASAAILTVDNATDSVGIGTNSPTEKLEVNGKIKATDINFSGLPTSSTGLSAGDVWNDSGTLKIV